MLKVECQSCGEEYERGVRRERCPRCGSMRWRWKSPDGLEVSANTERTLARPCPRCKGTGRLPPAAA